MEKQHDSLDYSYTDEITCPYCLYKHIDSWEASDEGDYECSNCGKEFTYIRDVEVTYISYPKENVNE